MQGSPLLVVAPTPGSGEVGEGLARELGVEPVYGEFKEFPDGEEYVRVRVEGGGGPAVVVATMSRPQSRSLVVAMLTVDALRNQGIGEVYLAAPYFAYARQDRVFLPGEPVSVRVAMQALASTGVRGLLVVELHRAESLSWFPGDGVNVRPLPYIMRRSGFKCRRGETVIVSPDLGGRERAELVARRLGCEWGYLVKRRDRVTGEVRIEAADVEVEGRDVVIVDDIVSTGGTLALAASQLLERGARRVYAVAAHYLGLPGVDEKLRRAGLSGLAAGNTLPWNPQPGFLERVDITPLMAEALKGLLRG